MSNPFVDTKLATKFGSFNIRVYSDAQGKETIVLWTAKTSDQTTPLVRIHSECMTGDTLGSLHCDCGEQLSKSLRLISESRNGVLIYLRQEGRGIGLFEKIKCYQLQNKGYDTFEANILLGHHPDLRTYEKAKTALADLGIKQIRLLTNNPSKVSEIAKFGIKVIERVPLVISPNEHNKKYLGTKRNKFKHLFNENVSYYFYQFHVENSKQVKQIGKFLKNKKHDPLLKIGVGVTADHSVLSSTERILTIKNIFCACELFKDFIPILHFSFRNSQNPLKDISAIKERMPFVQYIQTNDISAPELETIKLACQHFSAGIPLSDSNFKLIYDADFRQVITRYRAFILLDNSKGRGVREPKKKLMKKIDELLKYGLNDIAIFGGFGPDDLDTYFELRRYYKINFSIDAETKLKIKGKVDIEKTKRYLFQLIRFDDPKWAGIEQTREFLKQINKKTNKNLNKVQIEDNEFSIYPAVFNPRYFPSTNWYSAAIRKYVRGQNDFCEIGCGSGVISCMVALENPEIQVIASDINRFASKNTRFNAKKVGVSDRVKVVTGDVFDNIPEKCKFDTIFWVLPFGFLDPGTIISLEEMQVFDPGYKSIRKFLFGARNFLKPRGKLFIGFSSDLGHQDLLKELAEEAGIQLKKVAEKEQEHDVIKFELLCGICRD